MVNVFIKTDKMQGVVLYLLFHAKSLIIYDAN